MHQQLRSLSIAIVLLGIVTACSKSATVSSTWHEERPGNEPYSQIVVVVDSANLIRRRRLEDGLVEALAGSGNSAWASSRIMAPGEPLNRDTVGQAVASVEANAVVVTRLAAAQASAEETEGRTGVKVSRKDQGPVDFFRYNYQEYEEPGQLMVRMTASLSTDVYDADGGQLIFSMETTSYDKESENDVLDEVAVVVARRLRRERLVK